MTAACAQYQPRMGGKRLPPMVVDYAYEIHDCPAWEVESNGIVAGGLIMLFGQGVHEEAGLNRCSRVTIGSSDQASIAR
jgi:hypothetical protein